MSAREAVDLVRPRDTDANITEKLEARESQELIIAFSGAIGAGIVDIIPYFKEKLRSLSYKVPDTIKVSALIKKDAPRLLKNNDAGKSDFSNLPSVVSIERYMRYQDAGNALRERFGNDVLAQLTVACLAAHEIRLPKTAPKTPERAVFFIDSLKHHDEVKFLRQVYGNNFYLVGVLSAEQNRASRLVNETNASQGDVKKLIDRDRREDIEHGQQLDKALKLADFFIRNNGGDRKSIKFQIERFCDLIHGAVDVTPSTEEFGMYVAYSTGLSSSCMSRQVGASILDDRGTVLATGCNDVPKAGGGLYPYPNESPRKDFRCVMSDGICRNDFEKDGIKNEIQKILENEGIKIRTAADIATKIRYDTRLSDLLEFSRAVHAEMEAIIAIARKGGGSIEGATLYTTTYPCHNCARHILASGIARVLYLEPYEKSLALKLHSDAIIHDGDPGEHDKTKVSFLHFEGVAPRRYQDLFLFVNGRKEGGKKAEVNLTTSKKKIPQMLDAYRDVETKVVELMVQRKLIERDA